MVSIINTAIMNYTNLSLYYYEIRRYVAMFIFIAAPIVIFAQRAYSVNEGEAGQVQLLLSNPSSTAITIEVLTNDVHATGN